MPVPPLQLPPDSPPELADNAWNYVYQQALNRQINQSVMLILNILVL